MEKVFWLMWLSDLVGSIGVIGAIAMIAFAAITVILGIASVAEEDLDVTKRGFAVSRWLLIPIAVAVVTPSQKTVQILAVASAADAAAHTQLGAKGLEAIDALLDKVIKEAKK